MIASCLSMASRSTKDSPTTPSWNYDVFLSFRGLDVRLKFIDHLYSALVQAGIRTFVDDLELTRGNEISLRLLEAIEESRISIVVFSINYASSGWCLNELEKILECRKTKGQLVLPIFYHVDPSDVRKQTGSLAEAFERHEVSSAAETDKVRSWRGALREAASLSGFCLDGNGYESRFVRNIVEKIVSLVEPKELFVCLHPIGLDPRVEDVCALLRIGTNDVRMIGVYGMEGMGKTTIAKAVYNRIREKFESLCFLNNVGEVSERPNGLIDLQEQLLSEALKTKNLKVINVDRGIEIIRERLCSKRTLLVIDDLSSLSQMDLLAGKSDWFGPGSIIIITTRDKHLLHQLKVNDGYEAKGLDIHESLELISWHAFKKPEPSEGYEVLSYELLAYMGGIPLALEVLGSCLFERNLYEWIQIFKKLERNYNNGIQEIFIISFDALDDEVKAIFLEIACFFVGKDKDKVIDLLNDHGFSGEVGIINLVERCLLTVNEKNELTMHYLLRDMGKEIVHKKSRDWPGKTFHMDKMMGLHESSLFLSLSEAIGPVMPISKGTQFSTETLSRMENSRWTNEVFLSFSGQDTRESFVDHLHFALCQNGIHTFMDDEGLVIGESIAQQFLKVIKESSIAVVIFSRNYASSRWCLDELVTIMECKKSIGLIVYPVFYDVDPSEVRQQNGPFGEAFAKHETEKVQVWREALIEASLLSGWDLKNSAKGHEAQFIKIIIDEILLNLRHRYSNADENLIGIQSRMRDVKSLLGIGSDELSSKSSVASSFSASSSSSMPSSKRTYDVFLSFHGIDTRKNFVDHLITALDKKGIYTFMDEITEGTSVAQELSNAIKESSIAVVIFSKNYAFSSWCLNELVEIMRCKKAYGLTVLPVYYHVDPSDVRKQRGIFGEGLSLHKTNEVELWREALVEAGCLNGWDLNFAPKYEAKIIETIVVMISRQLDPINVRMIGILGMGGTGKTAIARAVFDQVSYLFDGASFVANVSKVSKEYGLHTVQKKVLSDILLEEDMMIYSVFEGTQMIIKRLCRRKVLLVLDDVDDVSQLEALVGEGSWFGDGSRVIIITRDKKVLMDHGVKEKWIYNVNLLNDEEAIQLFSRYAFMKNSPTKEYKELSIRVVQYAAGLPLALKVLGSLLCGKGESEWGSALESLENDTYDKLNALASPDNNIFDTLKISYDGLSAIEKEIFLYIACFFEGWEKEKVIRRLDSCGFFPDIGLKILVEKSLITISNERVHMHGLIKAMGRDIVRQENKEPGGHSRLWYPNASIVLMENMGAEAIEAMVIEGDKYKVDAVNITEAFKKMKNLRLLHVNTDGMTGQRLEFLPNNLRWLTWDHYAQESLPESFRANKLVGLELRRSRILRLWKRKGVKVLDKLIFLDLSFSDLVITLDFREMPNLQRLNLSSCSNLEEFNMSNGNLSNLVHLDLSNCKKLKNLPIAIWSLKCLETLKIDGCSSLEEFSGPKKCLDL